MRHRPTLQHLVSCLAPAALALTLLLAFAPTVHAQDNYEITVFGAETVEPRNLLVELHSNYTVDGSRPDPGSHFQLDGTLPTNHAEHETVQFITGLSKWSELGLYVFTSERSGQGVQWVGDHIRLGLRAPERWRLPVRLALSNEIGYQRARFVPDTWTWEIRPILDRQTGRWYFAINPILDRAWHGPDTGRGVTFAPSAKVTYDFSRKVNAGLEYYSAYGSLRAFDPLHDQHQQLFLASTLKLSSKWEFNVGVGVGATGSTDHLIVKTMLARRFNWGHQEESTDADTTPESHTIEP